MFSLIAVDDFDIVSAVEGAVGVVGAGEELFDFDVEVEDESDDEGDEDERDGDDECEDDEEDQDEEGEESGEWAWDSDGGGLGCGGSELFHHVIVGMLGVGLSRLVCCCVWY